MAVNQIADASVPKSSLTSSLFGVGGNVDGWVQAAYPTDAGKQFGWSANNDLSTVRANAEMLGVTPERARELMTPVNNPSIVGSPFSSAATAYAVPYPNIQVSELPAFTLNDRATPISNGTVSNLNGLESFMAFNRVGQAFGGAADRVGALASGVWNVASHPLDTAAAIGTHYTDAYEAGSLRDTVLGDVGSVLTGVVKSSPLGLVDAMYHQDQAGAAYRMGGAAVDAALFAGPSLAGQALDLGARGVASLGPTIDAGASNLLGRSGLLLNATEKGVYAPSVAIDAAHLAELKTLGFKFTPENVIATARNSSGQVTFLEIGNSKAGLQHIVDAHGADFANIGVSQTKIPNVIMQAINQGKLVGYQGAGIGRPIYEVSINGQTQRIAITTGNNGFIVGANPAGGVK